uniref:Formin-like protein n=1 Tax=Physcomitrium patens TaxID=3218 RepID=A0A2K1KNQ5_PHYPA|nr:hypothetical protein PHYPA_006310 [Physcomitrium patens]
MSLFRRFFYRRPPDGLLEITERVYVFDSCFSTDVFEDETYKIYMRQIATQLHEQFPDSSYLVFNFREGERKSHLTEILSQYDMTVMDYPRHYEGCPVLSMEMIHHFLRSSDSWLSLEGSQNIILMHCERGGWPLLAFILASFLIYRKLHTGELKTLDMLHKEAPKGLLPLVSPLNPLPSQLRYLQYVARRNNTPEWPPQDRALTLDCLMFRVVPTFDSEGGCRPLVRVYGQDPRLKANRTTKMLFSQNKKRVRQYRQVDCEIVKIDVQCPVRGDVVLECINLDPETDREGMMFRIMFNTAFIRSNILILTRDDIDIVWNAKERFPKDFRAEVLFNETEAIPSKRPPVIMLGGEEKEVLPMEAFAKVQELFSSGDWVDGHGDAALTFLQQMTQNGFQDLQKLIPGDGFNSPDSRSAPNSPKDGGGGRKLHFNLTPQPSRTTSFDTSLHKPSILSRTQSPSMGRIEGVKNDSAGQTTNPVPILSAIDRSSGATALSALAAPSPAPPPPPPPPPPFGGRPNSSAPAPPPPPPPPFGGRPNSSAPAPPPPPPPPFGGRPNSRGRASLPGPPARAPAPVAAPITKKPAPLKPLHWVKVTRALQGSLWADYQKQQDSARAPDIDMSELEALFSAAAPASSGAAADKLAKKTAIKQEKIHLVDMRRANNCEIMLTKVKVPLAEVISGVLALDPAVLDTDQVENLIKFCPTKEEMDMLRNFTGDKDTLGKCEQFFLEMMRVPRIEAKLRVFSFKILFSQQISELRDNLLVVNNASRQVRESLKLRRVMQTILSLGNALNSGTARGSAIGFKLDSLLKLTDTRARNNRMTLMHYLCKVVADKLPELLDFDKDLQDLEAATKIQLKSLAEEMQAVSKGLEKVEQEIAMSENDGPASAGFRQVSKEFLKTAESEVRALASLYLEVGRNADSLAQYFGEDPARCPFEQVISILFNFMKMFKRSYEENTKATEMEKKKAEKDAKDAERERMKSSPKEIDRKRSLQDRKEADATFSPLRSRIG